MFNQITWAGYCTALLILLLIYYLCVLVFYFKSEIAQLISGEKKLFRADSSVKSALHLNERKSNFETLQYISSHDAENIYQETGENSRTNLFPLVHELAQELHHAIQKAGKQNYKKEELIFSLQLLLKGYTELKETNFTQAINDLIAAECQNNCSIPLSEEELKMLWV